MSKNLNFREYSELMSLIANLQATVQTLQPSNSLKTVKFVIATSNHTTADLKLPVTENKVEFVGTLSEVLPAGARIVDARIHTTITFASAVLLAAEVGTTSSGHEVIGSGSILSVNDVLAMAHDHAFTIAPTSIVESTDLFVSITPGANWNLITNGAAVLYVTYIDITNV